MSSLLFQVYSRVTAVSNERFLKKVLFINAKLLTGILLDGENITYLRKNDVMSMIKDASFTHEFTSTGCLGVFTHKDEDDLEYKSVVFITERSKIGSVSEVTYYSIKKVVSLKLGVTDQNSKSYENVVNDKLASLFSMGNFFYGETTANGISEFVDISLNCDQACQVSRVAFYRSPSHIFLWNKGARKKFALYQKERWIAFVICGAISISRKLLTQATTVNNLNVLLSLENLNDTQENDLYQNEGAVSQFDAHQIYMIIITRISWKRPGFQAGEDGVDDYGCVAAFMETEQIVAFREFKSSYVQVRGSVPIFWTNCDQGDNSFKSVKITRGNRFSCSAMRLHLLGLQKHYSSVCCVSILGDKNGEQVLSETYQKVIGAMNDLNVPFVNMNYYKDFIGKDKIVSSDFNAKVLSDMQFYLLDTAYFACRINDSGSSTTRLRSQMGCVRVNCTDSLEKSNLLQSIIGLEVFRLQLEFILGSPVDKHYMHSISKVFNRLWALNGTTLTQLYTSTAMEPNLRLEFGEKQLLTKVGIKSASQKKTCFKQSGKILITNVIFAINSDLPNLSTAEMVRLFLLLPRSFIENTSISEADLGVISQHGHLFMKSKELSVTCATWNVNGGLEKASSNFIFKNISNWLLFAQCLRPQYNVSNDSKAILPSGSPDILAIGFQEIVDLTAKHAIMNKNVEKQWDAGLRKALKLSLPSKDYVLVVSRQLFGIAIFLYILEEHVSLIKDVDVSVVKTGFKGKIGTKGGVAVSLNVSGTSFCFISSHLAAGQKPACVENRNNDFATIVNDVSFRMYGSIYDHDYVFWMGDLNYRVDLAYHLAKTKIKEGSLNYLLANDQLISEMKRNKVFHGFKEGVIKFPPTYKFDKFTDIYDTSDKQRTPSFTDRILWFERNKFIKRLAKAESVDLIDLCSPESRDSVLGGPSEKVSDSLKLIHYGCADSRTSDHKPLVAEFIARVAQIDANEFKNVCIKMLNRRGLVSEKLLVIPVEGLMEEQKLREIGDQLLKLFHVANSFTIEYNSIVLQLNDYHFQDIIPRNFGVLGTQVFTKQCHAVSIVNMDWQEFDEVMFHDDFLNVKPSSLETISSDLLRHSITMNYSKVSNEEALDDNTDSEEKLLVSEFIELGMRKASSENKFHDSTF